MNIKLLFYIYLALPFLSFCSMGASVCGIEMPGTYHQSGHDAEFEIEVFKKMPHFQYYLNSTSHNLSLIIGEKVLSPELTRSLDKKTIHQWSKNKLAELVEIYTTTEFDEKDNYAFIDKVSGDLITLVNGKIYEQRLMVIKSLDCAIEFIVTSHKNDRTLVQNTINNFLSTLSKQSQQFWTIPNSVWYTDLGQANRAALTILIIMIILSIGLIFYVKKKDI